MEALWNLEDKWNLSTQEAVLFFACTGFLVIGLCAATALKRKAKRNRIVDHEPRVVDSEDAKWSESRPGWGSVKKVLMSSVRWSGSSKWGESMRMGSRREGPLLCGGGGGAEVGWQSHNSVSPVWQRPILMGEKCELPRFSGLILYDERGRPLHHSSYEGNAENQEQTAVRTTLRDLL
ncbi:unnamed protein product [Ilex paraguariensis]|uniref:Transmembrane protein n=1 Tax=Ilex paraguariensis TaxID=185542 RepID=A0ABC8S9Q6_9AQUA